MVETVHCCTHGTQARTYVCQHILEGLIVRRRVGFFWGTATPDNPRPDACCSDCSARLAANGGEWVGDALEHCQPQVLCGACYDIAKQFHMGGDPWV